MTNTQEDLKVLQYEEGWKRLRLLGVQGAVSKSFSQSRRLFYSERQNKLFEAVLYWIDNEPEWLEKIKNFEAKTGNVVYHAQLTYTEFGRLLSLMFVSQYQEEWDAEKKDLVKGKTYSYVINLDDEDCSEYGYIGVRPWMGGVSRVW